VQEKFMLRFIFLLLLTSPLAFASGVQDFNKVLMEDVKKDIDKDNHHRLHHKKPLGRGPASVAPEKDIPQQEKKLDKQHQLGTKSW
jgi:hypothetical protein